MQDTLLSSSATYTTATEYALAHPVTDYLLISINMSWGTKPIGEKLIAASMFVSDSNITLKNYDETITYTISERTASSIKVKSTNNAALLSVYGIMKK